jgi:hypothetical protein
MQIFIAFIFGLCFILLWRLFWHFIKHPETHFFLEGKAYAHEPTDDEILNKIMVLLHEEEKITAADVSNLLNIDVDEAYGYLEGLFTEEKLGRFSEGGTSYYIAK